MHTLLYYYTIQKFPRVSSCNQWDLITICLIYTDRKNRFIWPIKLSHWWNKNWPGILGPPMTQHFRSKWLHFFFYRAIRNCMLLLQFRQQTMQLASAKPSARHPFFSFIIFIFSFSFFTFIFFFIFFSFFFYFFFHFHFFFYRAIRNCMLLLQFRQQTMQLASAKPSARHPFFECLVLQLLLHNTPQTYRGPFLTVSVKRSFNLGHWNPTVIYCGFYSQYRNYKERYWKFIRVH